MSQPYEPEFPASDPVTGREPGHDVAAVDTEVAQDEDADAVVAESGIEVPEPAGSPTDPDEPADARESEIDDPDLAAARTAAGEAADDPEALETDELLPESDNTEYEPPDEPSSDTVRGETDEDQRRGESLDERVKEEEPDDTEIA